ncbi:protein toll-like isoform X2 [Galleria mellonella]|nr:protein toll-like isoform X2 [Galleria mellonella]
MLWAVMVASLANNALCTREPRPGMVTSGPPPPHYPQCRPPPAACTPLYGNNNDTDADTFYKYNVNGNIFTISYNNINKELDLTCPLILSQEKLDDSLPSFRRVVVIPAVYIDSCERADTSYVALLASLNVTGYRKLTLHISQRPVSPLNSLKFVGLNLTYLYIRGSLNEITYLSDDFLEPLKNLTKLHLIRNLSVPPLPPSNRLETVITFDGISRDVWGGCEQLLVLNTSSWGWNTSTGSPPPGWLSDCPKLIELRLRSPKLGPRPEEALAKALVGLKALEVLEISRSHIESLPSDFFINSTNLTSLDLSVNRLIYLPSTLLQPAATKLTTLLLYSNLQLPDLCDYDHHDDGDDSDILSDVFAATSVLRLPVLQQLSLSATNATRICPSWSRDLPALTRLELTGNSIHKLRFEDIKWLGARYSELHLTGNRLQSIDYYMEDYLQIIQGHCTKFGLAVYISRPLACDCHSYWFARTVAECPDHLTWRRPLRCSSGASVAAVPPASMVCPRYPDECAAGCTCYWRERPDATIANCSDLVGGRLPLIPHLHELNAAANQIESLENFPATLIYADLQYNRLQLISPEAAATLFSVPHRRLLLAGNPILCDCENKALIDKLQLHRQQVEDYHEMKCVDGRVLSSVLIEDLCALSKTLVLVYSLSPLAVLLILALISFGYFSRHQQLIKIFFYAHGWCLCLISEGDLDRNKKYDAFVSYSHVDEHFVFEHLVPQLEGEPHRFKLCIDTRDWVVGEWIPVQVALSVEESRRTIILLSCNFLDSVWGRLEFRTAHKSAMRENRSRVIIVLLEDVGNHQNLDKELKAYLSTNTYVKWGDPHFWEKLRNALPRRSNEAEAHRAGEEVAYELQRMTERRLPAITAPTASVDF